MQSYSLAYRFKTNHTTKMAGHTTASRRTSEGNYRKVPFNHKHCYRSSTRWRTDLRTILPSPNTLTCALSFRLAVEVGSGKPTHALRRRTRTDQSCFISFKLSIRDRARMAQPYATALTSHDSRFILRLRSCPLAKQTSTGHDV
jgi:hypothetical protein